MDRAAKSAFVEDIGSRIQRAPLVVLTNYTGVTVAQMNNLRRTLEKQGVTYRVVKNTLARRAMEGTPLTGLDSFLVGPTGVLISSEDPIASARVIRDFLRTNEKIVVKAGYFDGSVLDANGVKSVADLPSKEQLQAQVLALLQEGPRQILSVIQGPARDLVYLLNNYKNKLEEQGQQA